MRGMSDPDKPINPSYATVLAKIMDIQTRVLGMLKPTPEIKDVVDTEINNIKTKLIEVLSRNVTVEILDKVTNELKEMGL